jgi:RNA recognition motif-containing protein
MDTRAAAESVIDNLDGKELDGRRLTVQKSKRKSGRPPTPGQYLGIPKRDFGGRRGGFGGGRFDNNRRYDDRRYDDRRYDDRRYDDRRYDDRRYDDRRYDDRRYDDRRNDDRRY